MTTCDLCQAEVPDGGLVSRITSSGTQLLICDSCAQTYSEDLARRCRCGSTAGLRGYWREERREYICPGCLERVTFLAATSQCRLCWDRCDCDSIDRDRCPACNALIDAEDGKGGECEPSWIKRCHRELDARRKENYWEPNNVWIKRYQQEAQRGERMADEVNPWIELGAKLYVHLEALVENLEDQKRRRPEEPIAVPNLARAKELIKEARRVLGYVE